ncbi:hypothetical protein EJ04DRAFT_580480 [Polyplosphaeria fusca]|uniref:Uncharacterized protein n=1 Tax=Polyplosphaeria fusca TaxID=682080 RepID=A0A9P4UY33_9PLEO|nr:hypothetical protein EJ04DRAFT_580480 [Polyplosphaeria fusca]
MASAVWKEKGGDADFIEAWQYENDVEASDENFRHGSLQNDEITDWLNDADPLLPENVQRTPVGRIRMLICERSRYDPLDFPISRPIFEATEKALNLHPATCSTFECHAGTFSRYLTFADTARTQLERISIILKAPQKREIANYGLSLTHCLSTHTTTALLYGAEVLLRPNSPRASEFAKEPLQHDRQHDGYGPLPGSSKPPTFLELLQSTAAYWTHPLLLPILLLQHHTRAIRAFVNHGTLVRETVAIERSLGVTRVGHNYTDAAHTNNQARTLRSKAEELTIRINTHSTRLLFTSRSPAWNHAASLWMLKLLKDVEAHVPEQREAQGELRAALEFNAGLAEAAVDDVANMKERMALQLNVLYNLVAQMDNALNAQLAAAAGRDSTSMKILAFISAVFLPGSFVATVMSIDMFDWRYSSADGRDEGGADGVVSDRFWIYWVIAVPLTVLTLIGWGFWWRVEIAKFKENFKAVVNVDEKPEVSVQDDMEQRDEKIGPLVSIRSRMGLV